jgi:hypothetical protein
MTQQVPITVRKAVLCASFIEVENLAGGGVKSISFFNPTPDTLEAFKTLTHGAIIDYLELSQGAMGELVEKIYNKFECLMCLPDILRGKSVYHLLLVDMEKIIQR